MDKLKCFDKNIFTNIMAHPIPAAPKITLAALNIAFFFSRDELCRYDKEFIIAISGCSANTSNKAINYLIDNGYIERTKKGKYKLIHKIEYQNYPLNFQYCSAVIYSNLKYNEKIVLLAITMHIPKGSDWCFPSLNRIETLTQLSRRSLQRIINNLKDLNILKRYKHNGQLIFACSLGNLTELEIKISDQKKLISVPLEKLIFHTI